MATLGFLAFMTSILVLILIGVIIFVFRMIYGDKDEPRNEELVINLLSNYTDGYGLLLIKETESNKELIHITGSPRDIDYIKLKDKEFKIKDQDLFVRKDLFIPIDNSAHRRISIAFPDKPEQIPEKMKNTIFGKLVMEYIKEQNENSDNKKVMETQDKNKYILRKKGEGLSYAKELSGLSFDFAKELVKARTSPEIPKEKWWKTKQFIWYSFA